MKHLIIIAVLMLSGCRACVYIAIGPQSLGRVEVLIEDQDSDPNMVDAVGVAAAIGGLR